MKHHHLFIVLVTRHFELVVVRVRVGREAGLEQAAAARARHHLFDEVAELTQTLGHLLELFELRMAELAKRVRLADLDFAQAHVRYAVAHFAHVQQRRSK